MWPLFSRDIFYFVPDESNDRLPVAITPGVVCKSSERGRPLISDRRTGKIAAIQRVAKQRTLHHALALLAQVGQSAPRSKQGRCKEMIEIVRQRIQFRE